ncbi:amino acid adenylation domain-containing protein, partial [Nocardia terpenica]|uniref:AMP-binding protein n=1 Tax=Nocardia terpenica TaxID=455432 RepID=UPI002FE2DB5A
AIMLPRSAELVIAMLAVTKTGAAWLPIDPGYPDDRITYMVAQSRPVIVLETLPEVHSYPVTAPKVSLSPMNSVYVIYTSGSTGTPKGVVVTHDGVVNLLMWAVERFEITGLEKMVASTSVNFDVSVFELFAPLICGGAVEIVRDLLALTHRDVEVRPGSTFSGVPSAVGALAAETRIFQSAAVMIMAGEGLPASVFTRVRRAAPEARILNIYGPTEATVYATASGALAEADG